MNTFTWTCSHSDRTYPCESKTHFGSSSLLLLLWQISWYGIILCVLDLGLWYLGAYFCCFVKLWPSTSLSLSTCGGTFESRAGRPSTLDFHPLANHPSMGVRQCGGVVRGEQMAETFVCKTQITNNIHPKYIVGLVQERRNPSALGMQLRLPCTKPLMYHNKNLFY